MTRLAAAAAVSLPLEFKAFLQCVGTVVWDALVACIVSFG